MLIGLFYVGFAGALALAGLRFGPIGWVLLWPAAVFLAVGGGYLGLGPRMLDKRPDGSRGGLAAWVFLPYLGFSVGAFKLFARFGPSRPWDLVAPGIYLGRWPARDALPRECDLVVDLTSEFVEHPTCLVGRAYRVIPTLDGTAPELDAVVALVRELKDWPGGIYVHCAAGHSRSAAVVAALLIRRGLAGSVGEAMAIIRAARPSAWLRAEQRALVEACARRFSME